MTERGMVRRFPFPERICKPRDAWRGGQGRKGAVSMGQVRAGARQALLIVAVGAAWFAFGAVSASAATRDSDRDGMPNRWEVAHNLNPHHANALGDPDRDGLRNIGEFRHQALPHREDTDADGIDDGDEVHVFASDPTNPDEDGDGIADGDEDFDDDGIDNDDEDDGLEQCGAADDNDADEDGIDNEDEDDFGDSAHDADSDNDGVLD